jgi:hypothetical protein
MILKEIKEEHPDIVGGVFLDEAAFLIKIRLTNGLSCNMPVNREFLIYKDIISKYGGGEYYSEYGTLPVSIEHPEFVDMFKDAVLKWLKDTHSTSLGS